MAQDAGAVASNPENGQTVSPKSAMFPAQESPRLSPGTVSPEDGRQDSTREGQPRSPKDTNVETTGPPLSSPRAFPFHAPPGATGVQPTNDLLEQKPHERPQELTIPPQILEEGEPSNSNGTPSTAAFPGKLVVDGGAETPNRRGVQFHSSTTSNPQTPHQLHGSREGDEEIPRRERLPSSSRLFSKLKTLASPMTPGHSRNLSGWSTGDVDEGPNSGPLSPASDRGFDDNDDADEESAAEESEAKLKKKRKMRRRFVPSGSRDKDGPSTAPTTPRAIKLPGFHRSSTERSPAQTTPSASRPPFAFRHNTMSDIPEHHRLGYSEDEGRDRLRRGSKRPSGFRRITGLRNSSRSDNLGEGLSLAGRHRGDRTSSVSAQKWKQLKAGIKMLSMTRKKEQTRLDHAKSAELMAELLSGAPAALLLASMFQRDEHDRKRIPVLLEQIRVRVTDSTNLKGESDLRDRHVAFRIELEYGSALVRMKWVISRTWGDLAKLHVKYKLQDKQDGIVHPRMIHHKLPRFPRAAFPYMRNMRGLFDENEEEQNQNPEDDHTAGEQSGIDGEASGTDRPNRYQRRRSSIGFMRRTTGAFGGESMSRLGSTLAGGFGSGAGQVNANSERRENYAGKVRKRVEEYLQQMITYVIFRPDSNRMCKFLEISALGVRLAAEGGYHGKEGSMYIKSSKGVDFRKSLRTPAVFWNRHAKSKWFLVRQSYIVCVDSPENMDVYDVYLVDPKFSIEKKQILTKQVLEEKTLELAKSVKHTAQHPSHHQLKITNSERVTKFLLKSERYLHQFQESIKFMLSQTEWAKPHRYDSFAPVRYNCWAQPLVDGQDYMWNVSRAISMARDVIFIHDWWLSPELYLRRPAAISQEWRLDRLLKRKADEGVKIFVILYRNINSAIPIDSDHSKFSLIDLGPNVSVQRSPNQIRQNTFFWAHHEKVVVIDHCIAFCGGVDLCFGRWDSPEHRVVDDKPTGFEISDLPRDSDHCQVWPGKDYSNPRVQDFFALDKPYEEMYDRTKVPRMPWHDIGMQIIGQPARDLSRHFVQRWNFILRQRIPSRPTPMLLPPPDFSAADLDALDLTGSCEVQILRSSSDWSLGLIDQVEHSIMNAYATLIEKSIHFVYIENQFFISTCKVADTTIENKIGDALVERIIRAHENNETWRAVIVIPLMPGFQNTVDGQDGTSVRLIMQWQYYTICRGDTSIFERLRREGIDPEDYIEFYALRSWGMIGPEQTLVTEQLYIHAKVMIVDDRVAIIGSANINERSMLGSRDSEIAAVIDDTDRFMSTMGGKEFEVSRFAHGLRVRLMREHLGLDVTRPAPAAPEPATSTYESGFDSDNSHVSTTRSAERVLMDSHNAQQDELIEREHRFQLQEARTSKKRYEGSGEPDQSPPLPPHPLRHAPAPEQSFPNAAQIPALPVTDDTDIGGPPLTNPISHASDRSPHPLVADMRVPVVTQDCMRDPISDSFLRQIWHAVADNNTRLFRSVFRCMPDSEVHTWKDYKEYVTFNDRFKHAQHVDAKGTGDEDEKSAAQAVKEKEEQKENELADGTFDEKPQGGPFASAPGETTITAEPAEKPASPPSQRGTSPFPPAPTGEYNATSNLQSSTTLSEREAATSGAPPGTASSAVPAAVPPPSRATLSTGSGSTRQPRRRRGTTKTTGSGPAAGARWHAGAHGAFSGHGAFHAEDESMMMDRGEAEDALGNVQGHLVLWPYDWLDEVMKVGSWSYAVDQLAPLEIYI